MGSIEEAIADLKLQEHPNIAATAKKYQLQRSTLSRRYNGNTSARSDSIKNSFLLSNQQSKNLIAYIYKLTERGIPHTPAIVRTFAYNISRKWPRKT